MNRLAAVTDDRHERQQPAMLLPLPTELRPLSDDMAQLLRAGDVHARYASRSEAVMATALAAVNARWPETVWRDVLRASALADWAPVQHRKTGTLRHRNPADIEHRLVTTWRAALTRVEQRPPVRDAASVRAEMAALLTAADTDPAAWKGAAGVTDRAVLGALVDIALAAATPTPSASARQLAEAANVGHTTAAKALHRLAGRGWLRQEHPAAGTLAATYRLLLPQHLAQAPEHVTDLLEQLPPRPVTPAGGSRRAHDAFAHTLHGGLGRVSARIFDTLDDGAHGGLSVRQLAVLTGLHPRTIARHLTGLQAVDLATTGRGGATWCLSLTAGQPDQRDRALDAAAALLGSTGAGARRAARHAAHRQAYSTWWTDFTARTGWAVQRGLYRPEQPRLPLPQAA